jgi:NAD(P)H dehydrogenase (quinone)
VKLLVVVASVTGRTRRMAEAAAEGAREAGAEVLVRRPEEAQEADLLEADAVLLASAVHMGGIASSMRAFCERMTHLWLQGRLVGKLGAALVSAGDGERGGGELALLSLLANLAEHGMLLVPMHNRGRARADPGAARGRAVPRALAGGVRGPLAAGGLARSISARLRRLRGRRSGCAEAARARPWGTSLACGSLRAPSALA